MYKTKERRKKKARASEISSRLPPFSGTFPEARGQNG